MADAQDDTFQPELRDSFIKVIAESVGIASLGDDACSSLASEVTYRVKDIIEQADKFKKRGRRRQLLSSDIDRALRIKNIEPLYGFTSKDCLPFRFAGAGGRELYFHEDPNMELTQIVNLNAPKAPLAPQLKTHWLAIDGIQPAVPENPVTSKSVESGLERQFSERPGVDGRPIPRLNKTEIVQVRSNTTHDLSIEQQVYFKEITEACVGSDENRRSEALHSLETDTGLQAILPRTVVFLCEGVRCNVVQHNLALLIYLMRALKALVDNPAVNMEKYMHELIPAVLSCILNRVLCARPEVDNHWALRDFASRLLSTLLKKYGSIVCGLQQRITVVLAGAWQNDHASLAMLYGALNALSEMGNEPIKTFVVPKTVQVSEKIRATMAGETYSSYTEKGAADKLQNLLIKKLVQYVKACRPPDLQDLQDYRNQFGILGAPVFQQVASGVGSSARHSSTGTRPTTPGHGQLRHQSTGHKVMLVKNEFGPTTPTLVSSRPPAYQQQHGNYQSQISPTGSLSNSGVRSVKMHHYSRSSASSPVSNAPSSPGSLKDGHFG